MKNNLSGYNKKNDPQIEFIDTNSPISGFKKNHFIYGLLFFGIIIAIIKERNIIIVPIQITV
jgi:hypothetical protein